MSQLPDGVETLQIKKKNYIDIRNIYFAFRNFGIYNYFISDPKNTKDFALHEDLNPRPFTFWANAC